jgi:dimethylargininase
VLLALTRSVPPSIIHCELTHLEREPIDWARAVEQHEQYENVLRSLQCDVQRLPDAPEHPDSVFVEDTAVVVDECAVIMRPGAESRRGETETMAEALVPHRELYAIEEPGTLDGGDVVVLGDRVYVGASSRSNADGAKQLASILKPHGYTVYGVPVYGCLHLKTAMSALGDDRLLIDPQCVDRTAFTGVKLLEVRPDEAFAANVLVIRDIALCPAGAPRTGAQLEKAGFRVIDVDASELAKAEGGLTCCSVLLRL